MTSADYLRTTAADMRAKAEAASHASGWFSRGELVDDWGLRRADGALIARASPAFVLAVAEWLEVTAREYEGSMDLGWEDEAEHMVAPAMAVARAWNGEA